MFLFAALEMFARGDDGLMDGCWWLVEEKRTYFRPPLPLFTRHATVSSEDSRERICRGISNFSTFFKSIEKKMIISYSDKRWVIESIKLIDGIESIIWLE